MDTATLLKGTSVYLVGMMGSGKTTVGKQLAEALGYGYFDTDGLIENAAKQPVSQIFTESGETVFRDLETNTLEALSPMLRCTIATGGGIILKSENWGYLRNGVVVWLDASVDVLYNRLISDTTRPLLQDGELRERLETLDAERRSLYAQADISVVVSAEDTPQQITQRILVAINRACEEKAKLDAETERLNREQPFEAN